MQKKILIILILITIIAGLLSHLGYLKLRAEEPRRAIVSIEMYENGNVIVPTIHEETYYNKPPLYNWIIAMSYFLFQSFDEWAVRLPGIIFFLLTGLLIYRTSKKHIGNDHALLASLFYFTSADLLFYGTINAGEIDLFYSFIVVWQAIVIFSFFHRKKYLMMFLLSYALTFIGLITKGIPSLAFQALTILVLFSYYKKWKLLFGWQHILGILLFATLTGIFIYLYSLHGNVQAFIMKQLAESSDKSFNEGSLSSIITSFFKFPIQIMNIALPWTAILPLLLLRKVRSKLRENKLVFYSALFILSNIVIYWISPGVRNRYLYMFIPFISIIAAYLFIQLSQKEKSKTILNKTIPQIGIALAMIAIVVFPFFTKVSQHTEYKWLIIVIFLVIFASIFALSYIKKNNGILYLILVLALGRIWFNFAVQPYLESRSNGNYYKSQIQHINQITNKKKVFWTGKPYIYKSDLQLFGFNIEVPDFMIPPKLPYGIPYYQYINSGHLLTYDSVPQKGNYYLSVDTLIQEKHIDTLYQFKENWKGRNLVLFSISND